MSQAPAEGRRRPHGVPVPVHVVLLPAVPALALWAGNVDDVFTFLPVQIAVLSALAGVVLTCIFTVVQRDVRRSALIAAGLVFGFSTYGYVFDSGHGVGLSVAFVVAGLLALLSVRIRETGLYAVTWILNVTAFVLVASNTLFILQQRPTAPTVHAPADVEVGEEASGHDVWYLAPDRYPDLDLLEERGIDTWDFARALRDRDFTLLEDARANYPATQMSLASAWNARLLDIPDGASPVAHSVQLLRDPLIGKLYRDAGYAYHHVGTWFDATAGSTSATTVHTMQGGHEFYQAYDALTMLPSLRSLLPLGFAYLSPITERQERHARHQFSVLRQLAATEPTHPEFVLAHITLPHGPYVFRADGTVSDPAAGPTEKAEAYEEQLAYLNARLLEIVDLLQAREDPPTIVLLPDEGVYPENLSTLSRDDYDLGDLSRDQVLDKLSIMAAVYDPDESLDLPDSPGMTAVNVVRHVLNDTLDVALPPLPDVSYGWESTDGGLRMTPVAR